MTDACFNDTLDNFTFCDQSEKNIKPSTSISFDDSKFLNESFSFNISVQEEENVKENSISFTQVKTEETEENLESCVSEKEIGENNQDKKEDSKPKSADCIEVYNFSQSESSKLSSWGLPENILQKYASRNIQYMFPWQIECLTKPNVLSKNKNLVYSAPTSAGKTLVAEILAIKTVLEREKKVIFILPFVSVVREKMFYFQDIFGTSGVRVEGFMGSYNPPGGFKTVQVAICTIEKANSLVNRLLETGTLADIGAVIVDEMHLLGDPSRGYLLELLLTKLRYMSMKDVAVNIQIIGMSATLPNLPVLAKWLDAELYTTTFRPIPLNEQCHVHGEIYNNNLKLIRKLQPLPELGIDTDNVLQLCLETINVSCSVLIFCATKNWCENLAQQLASAFWKLGASQTALGQKFRNELNIKAIKECLEQLKACPTGLDEILGKTVAFGVGFHHAGLTMDERDIIEGAFRNNSLRVLIATSTLSSGVNLPARRVIIRSPVFYGKPINPLVYRQMIGRAGRMGKDTSGESILICQKNECPIVRELMSANLDPVESCLEGSGKLKRAILEVITSNVAATPEEIDLFTKCTLLANDESEELNNPIQETIDFLIEHEFIRLQIMEEGKTKYVPTNLAKACLSSSLPPEEGLALFSELSKARQCFVLETELHLIYLVTPYSAANQIGNIDWMLYLDMWEKLPASMKRVGELVGVKISYIINCTRGKIQSNNSKSFQKLQIHKRFYTALILQDLVNEVPLNTVSNRYNCNRGMLQSLQQTAATFAGMVTSFSKQLGWTSVELLISQFQDRLQFGISRDLLDLMRLPILNGQRARLLYNAGIESLVDLAGIDVYTLENILHKAKPFESEKEHEGETEYEAKKRSEIRTVWVTGKQGVTELEAAKMLVEESQRYLKLELGLTDAKWTINEKAESKEMEDTKELESPKSDRIKESNKMTEDCKILTRNDENQRNVQLKESANEEKNANTKVQETNVEEEKINEQNLRKGRNKVEMNSTNKENNENMKQITLEEKGSKKEVEDERNLRNKIAMDIKSAHEETRRMDIQEKCNPKKTDSKEKNDQNCQKNENAIKEINANKNVKNEIQRKKEQEESKNRDEKKLSTSSHSPNKMNNKQEKIFLDFAQTNHVDQSSKKQIEKKQEKDTTNNSPKKTILSSLSSFPQISSPISSEIKLSHTKPLVQHSTPQNEANLSNYLDFNDSANSEKISDKVVTDWDSLNLSECTGLSFELKVKESSTKKEKSAPNSPNKNSLNGSNLSLFEESFNLNNSNLPNEFLKTFNENSVKENDRNLSNLKIINSKEFPNFNLDLTSNNSNLANEFLCTFNENNLKDSGRNVSNQHNLKMNESKEFASEFFCTFKEENSPKPSINQEVSLSNGFVYTDNEEIIKQSDENFLITSPESKSNELVSHKRSHSDVISSDDEKFHSYLMETPTKKIKTLKARNDRVLSSYIDTTFVISEFKTSQKDISIKSDLETYVDLTNIEIINVSDERLFESFCAELQTKKVISLSVACEAVEEKKKIIGENILKTRVKPTTQREFEYKNCKVVGVGISWGANTVYYLKITQTTLKTIQEVFKKKDVIIRGFDCKEIVKVLNRCCKIEFEAQIEDPKIVDWLLEPEGRDKNLHAMALNYAPETVKLCELAGNTRGTGSVGLELSTSIDPKIRSSVESLVSWHLMEALKVLLQNENLLHIFEIEIKCQLILAKMEINGVGVDMPKLQSLSDELKWFCTIIENKAFQLAGRKFSFLSSSDVSKVIGLYKGKRVSTSKQVLEQNTHPISKLVLLWRKINSTLTKMVYPLLRMVENNRIHGTCITRNSTGRISMHEPNLQNVPRDFDFENPLTGVKVEVHPRKAFIGNEKNLLISADYCQLELRILAHLAQDELLCTIMQSNNDVFKLIAAKWNNIREDEVTDPIRQHAKQICYGIIYGMGTKTLSEQLEVSIEEAAEFVNRFHRTYPAIEIFIKDTVRKCEELSYVETINGRRRYLPHINNFNPTIKGQAERQAVNSTIQGSAADIAKNAMVLIENKICNKFKSSRYRPKLVLQLHDELIYEVCPKYLIIFGNILRKCMQESVKLSVPFPVKLKSGKSWGEMKELML